MRMIRRCKHSQSGWNSGDLDVAFQLFSCGMVRDGNLASKDAKRHFLAGGYAVSREGFTALTGRGTLHLLTSPAVWWSGLRRWTLWRHNPLVADDREIKRAVT